MSQTEKVNSTGSNVLMTVAANILIGLLSLGTGSLAARLLGVEGRGELAAIQITPFFIASVAQLGLPEALVYFSAKDKTSSGRYYTSALALIAVSSLVFGLIGYFALPRILARQTPEVISAAQGYLLFLLPLWTLVGMAQNLLRGRGELKLWNVLRVLPLFGWLLALIFAWYYDLRHSTSVATAFLVQMSIAALVLTVVIARKVPGSFVPDPSRVPSMMRYGLPAMASTAPQLLNLRLDQMLMAGLLSPQSLGLYIVAVAWSSMVSPVLQGLGSVLFPRVAALPTPAEKMAAFTQGSRLGVLVAIVLSLSLMAITPFLLPLLFGAAFGPAIPSTLILVAAAVIAGVNLILEEGLRGLGHPVVVMRAELFGLLVTVVSLILLLKPLGIMGAALASIIGYSMTFCALVFQSHKLMSCSYASLVCPTKSDLQLVQHRILQIGKK